MKKQTSEQKILNALKETGPMTQAELARVTKVKGVYQLVAKMIKENKVKKDGKQILLWNPGLKWPENDKETSEAPREATVSKEVLEYLEDEYERLFEEIKERILEYSYIQNQIKKLTDKVINDNKA